MADEYDNGFADGFQEGQRYASSGQHDENDDKPQGLTAEDVRKMTYQEINDRWPEVSKWLEGQR